MADALCGPSNPLQSFHKHATVDRTLQQDRLHSAASPVQGFRSLDPRQGSRDNEFAAFEASQPFQSLAHTPVPLNAIRHGQVPSKSLPFQPAGDISWASDFQTLRLNEPNHPIPQSQFRHEAPLQRSHPGPSGWHAEFMRQQQNQQTLAFPASQQMHVPQYGFSNSISGPNTLFDHQMPLLSQDSERNLSREQVLDHAAFEQAFAQMESHQMDQVEDVRKDLEDQNLAPTSDEQSEGIKIGSDLIQERRTPENSVEEKAEADDLARTAGDLLNALRHDKSDKFQQSQFLSLMRRIRDREVEVKDNDFAEARVQSAQPSNSHQPLHPGGRYYPEQSPPPPAIEQQANMSGAISGDDLAHFDKVPESRSLTDGFAPRHDEIDPTALTNGIAFRQESQSTA